MPDMIFRILGAMAAVAAIIFFLPMIVYICVRSGTAAYLITKERFLEIKKGGCDVCKGQEERENVGGSPKS